MVILVVPRTASHSPKLAAGLDEWRGAQLIKHHDVQTRELGRQGSDLASPGLVREAVHQIDGLEVAAALAGHATLAVMAWPREVLPVPAPPTRTMLR